MTLKDDRGDSERKYRICVVDEIVNSVVEANKRLEPAWIGCGKGRGENLSFNRRIIGADGKAEMHFIMPDDLTGLILGPNDDEIGVVKVANDQEELIAAVVNFACHPVTEMERMYDISADYPYHVYEVVESIEGGVCLFMAGPCGNIVPFKRERNYRQKIGRVVGAVALRLIQGMSLTSGFSFKTVQKILKLPAYKTEEMMAVEIQVFALGDILLVGMPGEVFTELGRLIKERAGYDKIFIYELCNGSPVHYVPTKEAYDEGGYEALSSALAPGSGEKMVEEILAIIDKLKPDLPRSVTLKPEEPLSRYSLYAMGGYLQRKDEVEKEG